MSYIANALRPEGDPQILDGGPSSLTSADTLARALGWFSIALGVTELVAAGRLSRALGLEGRSGLIRAFGAREIGAGVMTLSTERKLGMQSRVVGDAMDLLALGTGLDAPESRQRKNALISLLLVGGITALDFFVARALSRERSRDPQPRDYSKRSGFPNGAPGRASSARTAAPGLETAAR